MSAIIPSATATATQADLNTFEGKPTGNADGDELLRCPNSSLTIKRSKLQELVDKVCNDADALEKEMAEWAHDRDRYLAEHKNDFKHRKVPGTIFAESNVSFNQSRRNAVPYIARLTKDFFGVKPSFAVEPIRRDDDSGEAPKIQDFAKYKLDRSNLNDALIDAIDHAIAAGERVEKITHSDDIDNFQETDFVLVDGQGMPVRTATGDVIYQDDEWIYQGVSTDDMNQLQELLRRLFPSLPTLLKQFMQWAMPKTTVQVLKKDNSIPLPLDAKFVRCTYPMQQVHYSGPDICGLHHRDFLCSLTVDDIQKAPICIHRYDRTVPHMVEKYAGPDIDPKTFDPQEHAFYTELLENMQKMKGEDSKPKSAVAQPVHDQGETTPVTVSTDEDRAITETLEAYLECDAMGNGGLHQVMIVVNRTNRFAYFWDYTSNVTPRGVKRPFRVVRVTPERDRWYGISEYKLGEHKQEFIDWCLNRMVFHDSITGQFKFLNPDACEEFADETPVPGSLWYHLKKGFKAEDAISFVTLPTLTDATMKMLEMMAQSSQAERGNLSPGGDSLSSLPSSKLKYGIEAIQRSGDEIYALSAIQVRKGLVDVIEAAIRVMIAYMQPEEEYQASEYNETVTRMINKTELEQLQFNVAIEMTLSRSDQVYQTNQLADQIVMDYINLPAWQQALVRSFRIEMLKSLEIQNPDKALPMPSDEAVQASLQPPAPADPNAPAGASAPGGPVPVPPLPKLPLAAKPGPGEPGPQSVAPPENVVV